MFPFNQRIDFRYQFFPSVKLELAVGATCRIDIRHHLVIRIPEIEIDRIFALDSKDGMIGEVNLLPLPLFHQAGKMFLIRLRTRNQEQQNEYSDQSSQLCHIL